MFYNVCLEDKTMSTNLTPTRWRPTAAAAQVLAIDPVFPGIYAVNL
jgi:hypothetical protein